MILARLQFQMLISENFPFLTVSVGQSFSYTQFYEMYLRQQDFSGDFISSS